MDRASLPSWARGGALGRYMGIYGPHGPLLLLVASPGKPLWEALTLNVPVGPSGGWRAGGTRSPNVSLPEEKLRIGRPNFAPLHPENVSEVRGSVKKILRPGAQRTPRSFPEVGEDPSDPCQ